MAENVNILIGKANVLNTMNAYNARQAKLAEIAAKKELVSMSTAIDTAAAKGKSSLSYRLSGSISNLTGDLRDNAIALIEADITAAGYEISKDAKGTTYTFVWAEQAAEEESNSDPNEGNNGSTDNTPSGNNEPANNTEPTVYTAEQVQEVTNEEIEALTEGQTPVTQGWLESNGEDGYVASEDTEVDANSTYYKLKATTPTE